MLKKLVIMCLLFSGTACLSDDGQFFKKVKVQFKQGNVVTNPETLSMAAQYAITNYFNKENGSAHPLAHSPILENKISKEETENTLNFIINTIESDKENNKNQYRILNPLFLKKHFAFVKWNSDLQNSQKRDIKLPKWFNGGKLPKNKIKLTCYAAFCCKGSYFKTKQYPCALYKIKKHAFKQKYMTQFSREDILSGRVLERRFFSKYVKPLAWVSRKDLEDGFVQGSMFVIMPDGKKRQFNVHEINNPDRLKEGVSKKSKSYRKTLYWYFREIKNPNNSGERKMLDLVRLRGAVFAGDLKNMGAGKLIALRYVNPITKEVEILLGVLADLGMAFEENRNQLDLFAGIFCSRKKFKNYLKNFPDAVDAYILKVRQPA